MPLSCSNGCIMASEGHTCTQDDIRKRRTLSAANDRLTTLCLLFELFVTDVVDTNGISLVLLQCVEHGDQFAVELRIMLLNFFRDKGAFHLHLMRYRFNHLHKSWRTRYQCQIDTLRFCRNRQPRIGDRQCIRMAQAGDDVREFSV
ncbi:Hypothetical Protein PANA_0007 [Pantoea ananatis LMG 20103]|uniref:Uncharacterized protein n=1 Tax=Pantoea ananatis (strain LMG 20103) TaxID=706191 RepID=D4GFR0_PANAM|nr:Hypothetical Protein PANA_0007 [Pantoea ananatis LMG 20103]